jgi:hypothetical protein
MSAGAIRERIRIRGISGVRHVRERGGGQR